MIILTLSGCRGHLGHRVIGPSGHRIIGRPKTCAPGRVHQAQKDSEPKRNCLAVWSEATIIVPNFAARPTRAPGRVHQAQKAVLRKMTQWRVWTERQENWTRGPEMTRRRKVCPDRP